MIFFNIKFPLRLIKSFYYYLKELIEFKIQFNMHLETMQFYLTSLKWGDYKW